MWNFKREFKEEHLIYYNLDAVKDYLAKRIDSINSIVDDRDHSNIGLQILKHELASLRIIQRKLNFVNTMEEIREIKIIVEIKSKNSNGSNDFKSLREFMSFLRMKDKAYIADALGFDPVNNKLK